MMESSPRRSFTWPRGEGECWSIAPRFGELVLLYAGGWPAFEREYHPLAEEPRLFEELAALGLAAKEAGGRLAAEGSDLVRLGRLSKSGEFIVDEEGWGDEDRDSLAAHAAEDSTIQQQVLSFVNVYGPLDFGPRERGRGGAALASILSEAIALADAVALAKDVRQGEQDGELEETLGPWRFELALMLNERLADTRLVQLLDSSSGRLVPGFDCANLLAAMWLQLFERVNGGTTWELCKGCGRLFAKSRRDQRYHDEKCRNRAAVRRSRGDDR